MRPILWLYAFAPVALLLDLLDASQPLVFAASALAIVPAAATMGEATEQLAARSGAGVSGLVNVTFGNAPELIIAVFALADGLQEVVKASLVGSVVGNALLVMGASMLAGGWRRERQRFNPTAARAMAGMLLVTVLALSLPSVLQLVRGVALPAPSDVRRTVPADVEGVSIAVSAVLIVTYAAGLLFSLRTHRESFNPPVAEEDLAGVWAVRRSIATLAAAGALVAGMSDLLVGSIEQASHQIGITQFFAGAFVVAIVGNAAEHYVAVVAAAKDKIDLSVNIALGSSAQIGMFLTPLLVLLSFALGPAAMGLVFNGYELAALLAAGLATSAVISNGESTWYEGVQLLALYAVVGVVFYAA
ncbi:MAG: calcium/proton exchanger [Solirubrobacteraceae bacterium]